MITLLLFMAWKVHTINLAFIGSIGVTNTNVQKFCFIVNI